MANVQTTIKLSGDMYSTLMALLRHSAGQVSDDEYRSILKSLGYKATFLEATLGKDISKRMAEILVNEITS